jgi:hypothetical protein
VVGSPVREFLTKLYYFFGKIVLSVFGQGQHYCPKQGVEAASLMG